MSGHSKWHNIRVKKGKMDSIRGKTFSKITKELMVAARGGSNPEINNRLRVAIEKAKEVNMPAENIERAIKKGSGELEGVSYDEVFYEGYGPSGVAIMVEALTDNKNRTTAEIRSLFSKYGGSLGENGCVSWIFDKKGVIQVPGSFDEDKLMELVIECGAEDMIKENEYYTIFTIPQDLFEIKNTLEKNSVKTESVQVDMVPKNTIKLTGDKAVKLLKFLDILEEQDDVQNIYSNFDIDEEEIKLIAS
ncbi:MAG: putative transcriptional regulatory protein [candidate division WS2 bacterium]|nr:putative transcriptional regulatory protein [Candidatus Lithacetigena glycinireducens]MBT9174524.1 putative transcriptional regulatory protein [Candidatus Lithacetigena glycinireducens]